LRGGATFGLETSAVERRAHSDALVVGDGFVVFEVIGWLGHD
jgi:hypothetical protein